MKTPHDDGLEWLRRIRREIDAKCDHDLAKVMQHYREAAAKIRHRSFTGKPASLRTRKPLKMAA